MVENILIGVLGSIVASAFFYFWLFSKKPEIAISERIAKDMMEGQTYYSIKVVNRTPRAALDIRAMLCVTKTRQAPGGLTTTNTPITLEVSELFSLGPCTSEQEPACYAAQFLTKVDLDKEWGDDDHAVLNIFVYAKDEFSGFGKVFDHTFRGRANSIVRGRFKVKNSLDIAVH
ncbi:MAG: hypothetical protein J5X22_01340 [Candidatus Accumulibacter sp.]|jgi:hypothetical protein|uniref:hypothetical protein n=1 Tax=Accumulibacter sp. TaxID=2053492 RepID=UPI001B005993|nr:hypothetical protein [Accumulibacter sp.]MBO3709196.1 hypothetical protein [Accumulibacter sp.]